MSIELDFKKLIYTWKAGYDGKIATNSSQRREQFLQLFSDVEANLEENYLEKTVRRKESEALIKRNERDIIVACYNPNSKGAKPWRSAIEEDFNLSLAAYFPMEKRGTVDQSLLVKVLELKTVTSASPQIAESDPTESVYSEEVVLVKARPLDRSKLKDLPTPQRLVDEDMAKLLGFDNE